LALVSRKVVRNGIMFIPNFVNIGQGGGHTRSMEISEACLFLSLRMENMLKYLHISFIMNNIINTFP